MSNLRSTSFWVYLLLCYILLRVAFLALSWRDGRTISYDPAGYYLPLPAYFIYDDLAQFNYYDTIAQKYPIGDANSHTVELPNGNRTLKYSLGMSLLYSPGFAMGHQVAKQSEVYAADGYSTPYYFYLSMWSLLWAFVGLWMLRKLLLHYFSEGATAITLAILVLSTNYLIYAGINNLMSHSFLFTLYAFLLYFTKRWHDRPNWWSAAGIGVTVGLLALARPTEIIAILIPLCWGLRAWGDLKTHFNVFRRHWPHLVVAALIVVAFGSIQLVYWKMYTGDWLFYSYQEQGFNFLQPKLWKGLFSFRKGWLIYTPVMIFAILGFRWLYRQQPSLFWSLLLFSVINFYIVYSWEIWTYGGSVGSRAMVQSYAVWSIPLAAFAQYMLTRAARYRRIIVAILVILFTDLNLMMTWNSHAAGGQWHAEYMSRAYYWRIVGRTHAEKDTRKFLDVDTELKRNESQQTDTLVWETFEEPADTAIVGRSPEHVFAGSYALKIDGANESFGQQVKLPTTDRYEDYWLRASVRCFYLQREWHEWRLARLQLLFFREGQQIAEKSIRLQWLSDPWTWHDAHFEIPLDQVYDGVSNTDAVRIVVQNGGGEKAVYFDEVVLEWVRE